MDLSQIKPLFTFSRDFQRSLNDSSARVKNNPPVSNPLLQMKAKFDALQPMLESASGISEYKTVCDTTSYTIGATYSFKDIESLNNSINVLRNSSDNAVSDGLLISKPSAVLRTTRCTTLQDVYNPKAGMHTVIIKDVNDARSLHPSGQISRTRSLQFQALQM